jgi:DNA-binding response OmpR family regulator
MLIGTRILSIESGIQKKIMKRILIIEDELEMLRNLTTILRLERFSPLSAENGRVGVDLAKKQKPDLILCDVMMPGLDGYGVIAALRADAETVTIPFIFLTARAEKLDIRAGMNLGADDYITKPVAKADLLAAICLRLEPNDCCTQESDLRFPVELAAAWEEFETSAA